MAGSWYGVLSNWLEQLEFFGFSYYSLQTLHKILLGFKKAKKRQRDFFHILGAGKFWDPMLGLNFGVFKRRNLLT